VTIPSKAPARSAAAPRCAPHIVAVLTSARSSSARPLSIPPGPGSRGGFSLFNWWFSPARPARRMPPSGEHSSPASCSLCSRDLRLLTAPFGRRSLPRPSLRSGLASLATDQSGRAASGRSGRLVSTPAPSTLSVASSAGRRTRNRLVCWPLASGGSPRGAGKLPSKTRARFAPKGGSRRRKRARAGERMSCAM
jgi:hypothetical protein